MVSLEQDCEHDQECFEADPKQLEQNISELENQIQKLMPEMSYLFKLYGFTTAYNVFKASTIKRSPKLEIESNMIFHV